MGALWLFNIAMENGPFIDDCSIKTSIYKGFSMAMLNNQMVTVFTGLHRASREVRYHNPNHGICTQHLGLNRSPRSTNCRSVLVEKMRFSQQPTITGFVKLPEGMMGM
jgi:hypothetical protein